jgi:hypothetical protein
MLGAIALTLHICPCPCCSCIMKYYHKIRLSKTYEEFKVYEPRMTKLFNILLFFEDELVLTIETALLSFEFHHKNLIKTQLFPQFNHFSFSDQHPPKIGLVYGRHGLNKIDINNWPLTIH